MPIHTETSQTDWQQRLKHVVEMMREMSKHTDPQEMVLAYAQRVQQIVPTDRLIAISRRGLEPPKYRITRYSQWGLDRNPWKETDRLPVFDRGVMGELLYSDEPHFFDDLKHVQSRFDPWRDVYNHERPHEALGLDVPSSRYCVSPREYPERLPAIEYASDLEVRKTNRVGQFRFRGQVYKISEAFGCQSIGLRPTQKDGVWKIYYCHQGIGQLNVQTGKVERIT